MQFEDLDDPDGDGEINHPLPKDLMFDPWVTLAEPAMEAFGSIARQVFSALGSRNRKLRGDLADGLAAIVPAIVANLLVLHRERPEGSRLIVQMERRKKTRYDRRGFRKLPEVVTVLEKAGHVIK